MYDQLLGARGSAPHAEALQSPVLRLRLLRSLLYLAHLEAVCLSGSSSVGLRVGVGGVAVVGRRVLGGDDDPTSANSPSLQLFEQSVWQCQVGGAVSRPQWSLMLGSSASMCYLLPHSLLVACWLPSSGCTA